MQGIRGKALLCTAMAVALGLIGAIPAKSAEVEEITVTARKRQESILNVPIIEQAIPQAKLEAMHITEMTDLPKLVPGLNMDHGILSDGTLLSIRGIGTTALDPGVTQSVSLNIDGMSLDNGLAFGSGLFDLGTVEVLKGPQALFYGKSSPAGVISLRTADPTNKFEVIGRAEYEFESVHPGGELIVSGPVNDTLKLRLSTMYYHQEGYFKNEAIAAPGLGGATPKYDRDPWGSDYVIRGTALWDPSPEFSARVKLNLAYDKSTDAETLQCSASPSGLNPIPGFPPFIGGGEDCKLDRVQRTVDLDTTAFPNAFNHGVPFLMTLQRFGTIDLNYHPTPEITISSTTGYYHLRSESLVNATVADFSGPFIGAQNRFHRHSLTQEFRVNSDFKGPLNFTFGGLYEDGRYSNDIAIIGNGALSLPSLLQEGVTPVTIKTISFFGQGRWRIVDRLELAAGLRWTDEKRVEAPYNPVTGALTPVPKNELHPKNVAPEVTLTYRPTDDLTLFAAFKQAYKSGSFGASTPALANVDNSFGDEKVTGGEAGLKARLMDRQVALNVAPYYYRYTGLQVGVITPPQNGLPVIITQNAASAKTYGLDIDGAYKPESIPGLELNGAINWNHARFIDFHNAPCWGGQTVALGCDQLFNAASGTYTAQNLSGTQLVRAPDWQINLGYQYTFEVFNDYNLTFSNSVAYWSKYKSYLAINYPAGEYQAAYAKVDLGLTLQSPNNKWELSVIGKNITDKIISGQCNISNNKEGGIFATPYGTVAPSPTGYDEQSCFAQPGREIWIRITVRPFN